MKSFAVSAPGNLLVLGEYAVLEEGGRGLALAVAPRARAMVSAAGSANSPEAPRKNLIITGSMGSMRISWEEASGERPPPLLAACIAEAGDLLESRGLRATFGTATIDLDSSAFFTADGRKRGYGSSAAVALCLIAALLRLGGLEDEALEAELFHATLAAHRSAQGGRGSGYDIAASRFGGSGVFVGGVRPSWQPLSRSILPTMGIFSGPAAVSSAEAVGRYQRWKDAYPAEQASFFRASAKNVEGFLSGTSKAAQIATLNEAAALGVRLGDSIGVPARLSPPRGIPDAAAIKALGAGNELGLVASSEALASELGLIPVAVEEVGFTWE